MRRISNFLLVFSLLLANDGWKLPVQIMAWSQMLYSYSQTETLKDAVIKTFSGRAPCHVCQFVQGATKHKLDSPALEPTTHLGSFLISDFNFQAVLVTFSALSSSRPLLSQWSPKFLLPPIV